MNRIGQVQFIVDTPFSKGLPQNEFPHFIVTMRIKRSYISRFPTKTGQLKHFETVEAAISRPCTHSATDCFLFHARLLTRIFPYGRILTGQVGAFAPVSVDDTDLQKERR